MAGGTLKMYRARTMADALAEVKRDLGKDAVILHTRSYRVGGVLGVGARPMVEITASSGEGIETRVPARTAAERAYAASTRSTVPRADAPLAPTAPSPARPHRSEPRLASRPESLVEPRPARTDPAAAAPLAPANAPERLPLMEPAEPGGLEAEIRSMKRMMGRMLEASRRTGAPSGESSDAITSEYLALLENDVAGEIADEVVARVRRSLESGGGGGGAAGGARERVREAMIRELAALVPVAPEGVQPGGRASDARPRTIVLVGPTGVGKTTTIAKLAAGYRLRQGRRVGIATCDTYRIAAVEQLRTYAEIIGAPLRVAMTPDEMASACESLADEDILLVDTPGRSALDRARVDELAAFVAAARPHETHLVLSSAASERVMMETVRRFERVRPDRVIFTKLDEAVNFGVMLTVASRVALRLSFLTTGQEVPDHIEPGRAERLARLVLGAAAPRSDRA